MRPDNMPRPFAPEHSEDLRNLLAKARDEFMLGPAGKPLCDPLGISAPARSGPYLRNRIETAFVAGWNACEAALSPKAALGVKEK